MVKALPHIGVKAWLKLQRPEIINKMNWRQLWMKYQQTRLSYRITLEEFIGEVELGR